MKLNQHAEAMAASTVRFARSRAAGQRQRKDPSGYVIQRVLQALDVLEAFRPGYTELGVAEIAAHLRLSREVALRSLSTLERRRYLEHHPERGTYSLGVKAFELACVFLHHRQLDREAEPLLDDLAIASDETAYVAVRDGPRVTYLQMRETSRAVRVATRLGQPIPLHSSAAGKVHLAFGRLDRAAEVARAGLPAFTGKTMTDFRAFEDDLDASAERGYAIDDEETVSGVRCVAAPVFDHSDRIVAGIGLSAPAERLPIGRIESDLAPLLQRAAGALSHQLGYRAPRSK
ncbi:MAG: IclR family transcriptional regulator [Candidatus Methylomirabilaceae bacterium]